MIFSDTKLIFTGPNLILHRPETNISIGKTMFFGTKKIVLVESKIISAVEKVIY